MGYTHYWHQEKNIIPEPSWDVITNLVSQVINNSTVSIIYDFDKPTYPPAITPYEICFNGIAEEGHETFTLVPDISQFAFCKTANKPYDILVVATLIITHHIAPDGIIVTSDGNYANWEPGLQVVHDIGLTEAKIPKTILP